VRTADRADGALLRRLDDVAEALEQCRQHVRRLTRDLGPPATGPAALGDELRSLVERWQRAAEGAPAPRFVADIAPVPAVDRRIEACLRTVAAEAFTNVVRHAGASICHLTLTTEGDDLVLSVMDDGTGIRAAHWGVGLTSMRERLSQVDGSLVVRSPADGGTLVRAVVSLHGAGP
jgi:two-component system sensor histidine kinase UhpB